MKSAGGKAKLYQDAEFLIFVKKEAEANTYYHILKHILHRRQPLSAALASMTFEEYLIKKRINKAAFEAEDAARCGAWGNMYEQMHQNSFYMAIKMVINDVRLKYHLREEEVPKSAPVLVSPKPVMRRAPAASGATETAPAALNAQETSEAKPASTAATFKPRPVVKRPASLQKPPMEDAVNTKPLAEGEAATSVAAEETEKTAARPRPVIKRPAALAKPAIEQEQKPAAEESKSNFEAAETVPKPPRPRPVIKKPAPAATQEPTASTQKENGPGQQDNTQQVQEEKPKPPRPRPIIRRPSKPDDAGNETDV